ncbi:hypothetical protein NECID01_1009 [Nematocida sp. AWRm77]|nr:hypothetical protein NECID01_1009 [Nematocida sp. AWRm77]
MDRTKEFLLFAGATNVPQRQKGPSTDARSALIASIEEAIQSTEAQIVHHKSINKEAVRSIEERLHKLYTMQVSEAETEVQKNILGSIRRKYASLSLRLAGILRESQRRSAMQEEEARRAQPIHAGGHRSPGGASSFLQKEAQHSPLHREEISTVRRREMETIETHINELGKMIKEVSMHITMQEERLQRVDELFSTSKTSIKKGSFELNHTLSVISQRRQTILTIFGVLFALLLLYAWL